MDIAGPNRGLLQGRSHTSPTDSNARRELAANLYYSSPVSSNDTDYISFIYSDAYPYIDAHSYTSAC